MLILFKTAARLILAISLVFFISGCSLIKSNKVNANCTAISGPASAEFYYDAMLECVHARNYTEAALLYGLGGTTTWYDAQKHPGEASASRHKLLLSNALNQLQPYEKDELWKTVNTWMKNPADLNLLCSRIESRSPDNASNQQWKNAMASYLHCPLVVNASAL